MTSEEIIARNPVWRRNSRLRINAKVQRGLLKPASAFMCRMCAVNQAAEYHHHKGHVGANRWDVIPVCRPCHKSAAFVV